MRRINVIRDLLGVSVEKVEVVVEVEVMVLVGVSVGVSVVAGRHKT